MSRKTCTQTLDGTPMSYFGLTSWSWVTSFKSTYRCCS